MSKGKKTAQCHKFIDKARELVADDDEFSFEKKLQRIAKAGPQPAPKPKNKDRAQ